MAEQQAIRIIPVRATDAAIAEALTRQLEAHRQQFGPIIKLAPQPQGRPS